MQSTRRSFIQKSTAAGVFLTLPKMLKAELSMGAAKLSTLSDGTLTLPRSFILGNLPEEEANSILNEYGISGDQLTPPCNVTLYQDGTNNVLFDVGAGADFQPSAGKLMESLDALGLAPDDITHVVFTHAHPDHIWGLLDDFDEPSFANASYMMGRQEWDYWWNPETVNEIGDARAAFAVGAKRRMEVIEDQVEFFDDNQEILPGILSVLTPGHTPGHMSFEVRQGNQAAMIIGDAIGNSNIAFRKPDWEYGSDQDPMMGAETRTKLFDRITADQIMISGFHMSDGGIGQVEKSDEGYIFTPDQG